MKAAIVSLVEELEVNIRRDSRHRAPREEVTEQFEQFSRSFFEAQQKLYSSWEEKRGFLGAMEKEQLYIHGFMDGYKVNGGFNE
ncbi:hypothetical protein GCM10010911_07950 [Paenibacillus nasutitermitis]|uniref:Uncharacterized protein n=1 Tax=Paenibacillus nasutitermitis TaxID=1652958 RepID=A0A917DMI6_9BACL|nr:hypothetical protein GCM10010911_07950 [Paenibacillus nasutitermitis]